MDTAAMSAEGRQRLARRRRPAPDRAIITSGKEGLPVRREADAAEGTFTAVLPEGDSPRHVPEGDDLPIHGSQGLAVWGKSEATTPPLPGANLPAGCCVPQPDRPVIPSGRKHFTVGRKSHGIDLIQMSQTEGAQPGQRARRKRIAVAVGACHPPPIRRLVTTNVPLRNRE